MLIFFKVYRCEGDPKVPAKQPFAALKPIFRSASKQVLHERQAVP